MAAWRYVEETPELVTLWDDDTRRVTAWDPRDPATLLVDRAYNEEENAQAEQRVLERTAAEARIDDLRRRVEILEAAVFGSPEVPTDPDDPSVKTWAQWGGIVPPGQLLLGVDGNVYRNVAGVPLTTPPSGMPGGPGPWGHLWALVLDGEEPDDPGDPEAPAWAAGVSYQVGDVVQYNGRLYECKQAHTSLAGWEPTNVPALWTDLGPA